MQVVGVVAAVEILVVLEVELKVTVIGEVGEVEVLAVWVEVTKPKVLVVGVVAEEVIEAEVVVVRVVVMTVEIMVVGVVLEIE